MSKELNKNQIDLLTSEYLGRRTAMVGQKRLNDDELGGKLSELMDEALSRLPRPEIGELPKFPYERDINGHLVLGNSSALAQLTMASARKSMMFIPPHLGDLYPTSHLPEFYEELSTNSIAYKRPDLMPSALPSITEFGISINSRLRNAPKPDFIHKSIICDVVRPQSDNKREFELRSVISCVDTHGKDVNVSYLAHGGESRSRFENPDSDKQKHFIEADKYWKSKGKVHDL